MKRYIFLVFFMISMSSFGQFYTGSQMDFGKNRVQYRDFIWSYYRYSNFDVYFYRGGEKYAAYTSEYAKKYIDEVENQFKSNLINKIQFIIFNNVSDLKQSNLGLMSDDATYNIGGITHILGSKVFLYFNGDYKDFRRQIRAGVAQVIISEGLNGGSIGAQVKSDMLVSIPDWYRNGLISFLVEEWSVEIDNSMRDLVEENRLEKFNRLTEKEADLAGHSIWKYINDVYGAGKIPDVINMTQMSRGLDRSLLYVLNVSYKQLMKDWREYYEEKYKSENSERENVDDNKLNVKNDKKRSFSQFKASPDGRYFVYATNQMSQYKIWLLDTATGKKKKLLKRGYKLEEKVDYTYPLIDWHPSGEVIAIILKEKGFVKLYQYNIEEKKFESRNIYNFQKINSFGYSDDGCTFVMSAVKNGHSDIFIFDVNSNSYSAITNDPFDDADPCFISNSSKIVFSSDRTNDTLNKKYSHNPLMQEGMSDLFIYDYKNRSNVLKRVTNTPVANEKQVRKYGKNCFTYLSDENGVYNRYIAKYDSAIAFVDTTVHYRYFTNIAPLTNYSRNIVEHQTNIAANKSTMIVYKDQEYHLFYKDMEAVPAFDTEKLCVTEYGEERLNEYEEKRKAKEEIKQEKKSRKHKRFRTVKIGERDSGEKKIDIERFSIDKKYFIVLGGDDKTSAEKKITQDKKASRKGEKKKKRFSVPKRRFYEVQYSINELVNQADFSYLNRMYQPFQGGGSPIFLNSGFNALFKIGISDLMENYRIIGGISISPNLVNNEYLLSFANLKNRLDREIIFHRSGVENESVYPYITYQFHEVHYKVSWPFNRVMSVRARATYRNDNKIVKSTEAATLEQPNVSTDRLGLRASFVYDDTRSLGLNIYEGTRFKAFAEYYQVVEQLERNFVVVGLDYRKYIRIHRNFVWANRFAASTSFGNEKLIYYLGGVDNWLMPSFNKDIEIDYSQNYLYQTLATNMRGFKQNIRNGNTFAVLNSELRFPVFGYFFNRPIKSKFLKNFQIVGFADVGSAWNGLNPYDKGNVLFSETILHGPIEVNVQSQIEPVVAGYGVGVRSTLFGYFVRADFAWGYDDGSSNPMVFYLSFDLDF
ncbi:MAG: hypothetical protein U9R32_02585 [Bacteroidota bacterium]|nr:hypothetical protein [Bacteroidota bacterium]